jgi:hypothetical protein
MEGDRLTMPKPRLTIVALLAVTALSTVGAASASASGWHVSGTELKSGENVKLATAAAVDSVATLSIPKADIKIQCNGSQLKGTSPEIIGGTNEGKASSLTFTGCSTTEPSTGCELSKTEISTVAINASVTDGTSPLDIVKFTPQSKSEFTEIPFKTGNPVSACNGPSSIKGSVNVVAPTGQEEKAAQVIEGVGSAEGNNSLEILGDKAFIECGSALLKLESGSKWSFK